MGKLNVTEINADRAIELSDPVQCCLDRRYQNSHSEGAAALPIRPSQLNIVTSPSAHAIVNRSGKEYSTSSDAIDRHVS